MKKFNILMPVLLAVLFIASWHLAHWGIGDLIIDAGWKARCAFIIAFITTMATTMVATI